MNDFSAVLAPTSIGGISVRNRLGLAPLNTGMIDEGGLPSVDFQWFHERYARAGLGIVFIGGVAVCSSGRSSARSFSLDSKRKSAVLSRTLGGIRDHGALPIVQLMHAGRQTNPAEVGGRLLGPSAVACPVLGIVPREMTRADFEMVTGDFVNAAKLAEEAGAAVIELHAAHGYLLAEFLSEHANHRRDQYGGSPENRARFLCDVIREIRSNTNLAVGVRISGREYVRDGIEPGGLAAVSARVEEGGAAYISVSAGVYSPDDHIMPDRASGEAVNAGLSRIVKHQVQVPVMLAGNMTALESCVGVLLRGQADILLMGRALLADWQLVPKTMHRESVQPCTMLRVCKYHSRRLPHIACPHDQELWARLSKHISVSDATQLTPAPDPGSC